MYCTECGTAHDDSANVCSQCGVPLLGTPAAGGPVESYLTAAILVTLCCCVPFGIPAIVFAAGVNGKVATGDLAGAREASRKARMWVWISFGSGLAFWLIYMLFAVIAGLTGAIE